VIGIMLIATHGVVPWLFTGVGIAYLNYLAVRRTWRWLNARQEHLAEALAARLRQRTDPEKRHPRGVGQVSKPARKRLLFHRTEEPIMFKWLASWGWFVLVSVAACGADAPMQIPLWPNGAPGTKRGR